MKGNYLAGVYTGITGLKAAIFDLNGKMVCSGYSKYTCSYLKSNWVEQNPDDLVSEVIEASKEVISNLKVKPRNIASSGFLTQRSCYILSTKDYREAKILWKLLKT